MASFVVEGGQRIKGEVTPGGNKNEALPAVAASLLTDEEVVLENVPHIRDVEVMLQILRSIGGQAEWRDKHTLSLCMKDVETSVLDRQLCAKVRASVLLAGPLLVRFGRVVLPPPGGDVIGRRKLDTLFGALGSFGASIRIGESYRIFARNLVANEVFLEEASVTGTENTLMVAALTKGTTVIENAACEPHVQGLCRMLKAMGAEVEGIGTNRLVVRGAETLKGVRHRISSDYLEVGSLIGLGALVGDGLTIHDVSEKDMRKVRSVFAKLGVEMEFAGDQCFVPGRQRLQVVPDVHGTIPQIDDAPWPQFPTDLMSIAIVVATQAQGTVLFFEKMYEGRMFFVDSLLSMGANIILCDPHRVVVAGPSRLYGTTIRSPDIRAGMALLIASMAATGRSTIHNIEQIERGYEDIQYKLTGLGAKIERLDGED